MEMNFEVKEYHRNIPEADCVADLIAVSKKIGKPTLTINEYSKHGKYNAATLRKKFGSWYKVLEAAGLKPIRRRWKMNAASDEVLFNNLTGVWIKLGRQPTLREMTTPLSLYHGTIYVKYFGSWMSALRKFGAYKRAELAGADEKQLLPAEDETLNRPGEKIEECGQVERDKRKIPLQLRFNVFRRDGFRCVCCGRSPSTSPGLELHCDHIVPWSKGGRTILENLQTLCAECNIGKGDRMVK